MAQFNWIASAPSGCLACMTAVNDRGFVDLIGETAIKNPSGGEDVVGVVDIYYCANCVEQAAKQVGSATKQEVEDLVYESAEKDKEIEKLKDEIQAHQQRFEQMVANITGDVDWKTVLKEKSDDIVVPPA